MSSSESVAATYIGERYALAFPDDRPFVHLTDASGRTAIAELFFPSSVHPCAGRDDTTGIEPWTRRSHGDVTIFTARARSSVWGSKLYRFLCTPDRFRYEVTVEGEGALGEAILFGGYCSAVPRWGSGFFVSDQHFTRAFNPEPNTEDRWYFEPSSGVTVDLTGAPLAGKRHWFFTPPPFCLAFGAGDGWLAIGVDAPPGAHSFTEFRYSAGEGFTFTLPFEGHTRVDGRLTLPALCFDFADDEFAALGAHVAALRTSRSAPSLDRRPAEWWALPMFCGWGAQCARAAERAGYVPTGDDARDGPRFLATLRHAQDYARQDVYESFLSTLRSHDLHPGTVTIDDKWQACYGLNDVDPDKWPNLPGFIRARHSDGQHVLLWLKAWDPEGVPDDECIRNRDGVRLGVDPTNPAFERRLRASVRRMLSVEGYGADGFKIDFTHRIPVGPGLIAHGPEWGLELMKKYLGIIHSEAQDVKPDALIMTHTPHPYLADVVDMIRLNDMLDLTRLADPSAGRDITRTVSMRARVARIAMPQSSIDTDNWPVRDKATWREYVLLQPSIGVPSLYFVDRIDVTQELFDDDDYDLIREVWNGIDGGTGVTGSG